MATSNIKDLNFSKGVIEVLQVWKTRLKIKHKAKTFVIWIPKDLDNAKVGDIFFAKIEPYTHNNEEKKRMRCNLVKTISTTDIPISKKTNVILLNKENGLVELDINRMKFIMKLRDISIMNYIDIGTSVQAKKVIDNGMVRIEDDVESLTAEELFT